MNTVAMISKLEQIRSLVDECLGGLRSGEEQQGLAAEGDPQESKLERTQSSNEIDLGKPVRPFMKNYDRLSGTRKFVLLLAWVSKGDLEKQVSLSEVVALWSGMKGMLGMDFNRKFSTEAKDKDWVESKKHGFYNLRPSWGDVLKSRA